MSYLVTKPSRTDATSFATLDVHYEIAYGEAGIATLKPRSEQIRRRVQLRLARRERALRPLLQLRLRRRLGLRGLDLEHLPLRLALGLRLLERRLRRRPLRRALLARGGGRRLRRRLPRLHLRRQPRALVGLLGRTARARTCDRAHGDFTLFNTHQHFGRAADHVKITEVEEVHIGRRVLTAQRAVQINRLGLEVDAHALGRHHLHAVAGKDVFLDGVDRPLVVFAGEAGAVIQIGVDRRGEVYVADRENARVQVFDTSSGRYKSQWLSRAAASGRQYPYSRYASSISYDATLDLFAVSEGDAVVLRGDAPFGERGAGDFLLAAYAPGDGLMRAAQLLTALNMLCGYPLYFDALRKAVLNLAPRQKAASGGRDATDLLPFPWQMALLAAITFLATYDGIDLLFTGPSGRQTKICSNPRGGRPQHWQQF